MARPDPDQPEKIGTKMHANKQEGTQIERPGDHSDGPIHSTNPPFARALLRRPAPICVHSSLICVHLR
jgi:hypothetical protein